MCGRYTIAHSHREIIERFRVEKALMEVTPRYNVAPSQIVPVIIDQSSDNDGATIRTLEPCKWGLIPSWVKDLKKTRPMINARGETIVEKPSFRSAFKSRRCLIPADGFYEWRRAEGKKIPVRIKLQQDDLFAFAGLYEDWRAPDGENIRTCTIITVAANEKISTIHDRMPVILPPELEDSWLSPPDREPARQVERLVSYLAPYDQESIEYYTVSTMVNSPRQDTPECIAQVR